MSNQAKAFETAAVELYNACKLLLASPDLNLENLEEGTIMAIMQAEAAISKAEHCGLSEIIPR